MNDNVLYHSLSIGFRVVFLTSLLVILGGGLCFLYLCSVIVHCVSP